jgi:1-deoxy-D-xylulose-5-phosphate synthase
MILQKVNNPEDLRKLPKSELKALCSELREYIVDCCAENPGHLASSLGAVELIVGLHYVFNTPKDKIIFDVGHQAYAHKILTGRREAFKKNRMPDGISGFPVRSESEYDAFGTGHASTSISAALGIAKAAQISGSDEKVIALIGDGAMTGGLALEGLNNAGDSGTDLLIVLNDNDMAIDGNKGGLHSYLLKLTTDPRYNELKNRVWNHLGESKTRNMLQRFVRGTKKGLVTESGGDFFEAFGFRYFGPIDGNDIDTVVDTLERLKDIKGPKVLHTYTVKGKGYAPAENDSTVWHAPGKFDPQTGKRLHRVYTVSRYQDVFGEVLCELARKDPKVVAITPAMAYGSGLSDFAKEFPDRFFDVGIEEEHAVTFSAGLAAGGMKPFCSIYSTFAQRAHDQIIHDVALQKLPVVLCIDRAGLVGEDGATHQGVFDMASLRCVPNVTIAAPMNELELKSLMYMGLNIHEGPLVIRYPRGLGEGVDWKDVEAGNILIGKGRKLVNGEKVAILALGPEAARAVEAAEILKKDLGICPTVFDMRFLKPIDEGILEEASHYINILTVEDGVMKGGLYGEVCEWMEDHGRCCRVSGLGVPDMFIRQAPQSEQRRACGLDAKGIATAVEKLFQKT